MSESLVTNVNENAAIKIFCDEQRHLVCVPFSVENLHRMASFLGIKRCWFHKSKFPHYDIPKRMIADVTSKCIMVTTRDILLIVKG